MSAGDRAGPDQESTALLQAARLLEPLVGQRLAELRRRIESAGGDPAKVRVVAVTKTFGPEAPLAAIGVGLVDIGENYAAELAEKEVVIRDSSTTRPNWHFIGAIQRNKIGLIAPIVDCWQSVSRAVEAESIVAHSAGQVPTVFVEVNVSGDPSRAGCPPGETKMLVSAVSESGLEVRGLMAVAPLQGGAEAAASAFLEVARLREELGLAELSIGMSGDIEAAVQAGSTMVRVGSALFGPRNARTPRRGLQE